MTQHTATRVARSVGDESGRILLVGLGNRYRRDDGVGPVVAEQCSLFKHESLRITVTPADPSSLIDRWQGVAMVILVDATQSGECPGTIFRFEPLTRPLPEDIFPAFSTHTMGISQAINLGRALKRLPNRIVVYGIEGSDFGPGEGLSESVQRALPNVLREIQTDLEAELGRLTGRLPCTNSY